MAYTNPGWVNNAEPSIDADNLNQISSTLELVPVGNGGTGTNTLVNGGILRGNGSDPISTLSGTGALFATSSNNPQFGTLPVNCGGTGATSLASLKSAMGLTKAGWIAQSSAPSDTNLLWIDTANKNVIKFHNGSSWVACTGVFG